MVRSYTDRHDFHLPLCVPDLEAGKARRHCNDRSLKVVLGALKRFPHACISSSRSIIVAFCLSTDRRDSPYILQAFYRLERREILPEHVFFVTGPFVILVVNAADEELLALAERQHAVRLVEVQLLFRYLLEEILSIRSSYVLLVVGPVKRVVLAAQNQVDCILAVLVVVLPRVRYILCIADLCAYSAAVLCGLVLNIISRDVLGWSLA